jgi:hypothetical protein
MKESHSQKAVSGYNAATGTSSPGFDKASTKYSGNQHTRTNPDALINKGRGPTGGGTAVPNRAKEITMGCHNPQQRQAVGDGATKSMPKFGNTDKINVGRGPTKGNQL